TRRCAPDAAPSRRRRCRRRSRPRRLPEARHKIPWLRSPASCPVCFLLCGGARRAVDHVELLPAPARRFWAGAEDAACSAARANRKSRNALVTIDSEASFQSTSSSTDTLGEIG